VTKGKYFPFIIS